MISYPSKLRAAAKDAKRLGQPETELVTLAVPGVTLQTRVKPSTRSTIADLIDTIIEESNRPYENRV